MHVVCACLYVIYLESNKKILVVDCFSIGTKTWRDLTREKWPSLHQKFAFNAITKFLFSFLWNKSFVLWATYIDIDYSYLPSVSYYFRTQCNQYLFVLKLFWLVTGLAHTKLFDHLKCCVLLHFLCFIFFLLYFICQSTFLKENLIWEWFQFTSCIPNSPIE